MIQRVVSRQEAYKIVQGNLERQAAQQYPDMPRHLRRNIVRKAAREAMKNTHGSKIVVTRKPATWWQRVKEAVAPEWFINRFPVQYVER